MLLMLSKEKFEKIALWWKAKDGKPALKRCTADEQREIIRAYESQTVGSPTHGPWRLASPLEVENVCEMSLVDSIEVSRATITSRKPAKF